MSLTNSPNWFSAPSGFYSHTIDQSLRFEDGSAQYLYRTPSSGGNQRTWTWSAWHKKGNLDLYQIFFMAGTATATQFRVVADASDDKFQFYYYNSGNKFILPNAVQRDTSAWYHVVFACDTTQATSSNRLKLYINGEQVTSLATENQPSQNYDTEINRTILHTIGRRSYAADMYLDGYLADVNFIDGQQLDPTYFGETKAGIWIPKDTSDLTFGTNGFRLQFQDSSSVGDDTSGNGNDFTASGFAATDVVLDSPTNNWCTINSASSIGTQSEGNLKQVTASTGSGIAVGSIGQTSGKWYWEVNVNNSSSADLIGVVDETLDSVNSGSYVGYLTSAGEDSIAYYSNGNRYINGSAASYGATFTTGDIIGVALNLDDNEITFYKNNSSQGAISYTFSGGNILPAVCDGTSSASLSTFILNFGQDSSFAGTETAQGNTDANGKGDFYYSPPSGFLCLASVSLPDPAIDPAQDEEPADYFNTVLYTGTGSTRSVTGVGFQPDFVWIKDRTTAYDHHLFDVVRGGGNSLYSNDTVVENTYATDITFASDGFSIADGSAVPQIYINKSSDAFVSWNWLAGGSASSNTDGSITSSVSANTEAGFSIVSYTGSGSAATVGHGLNSAPDMYIIKDRDSGDNWVVYHKDLSSASYYLTLDTTNQQISNNVVFNGTDPTTSVFSVGTSRSTSGNNFIAYCFHSVDGYSKVGSYTGNGSSDGPFIYTGFRPAWVMVKKSSATQSWAIMDNKRQASYNDVDARLFADLSNAESTGEACDFVSNGFKIRSTFSTTNSSSATYIYLAFAEQPFKYANAR